MKYNLYINKEDKERLLKSDLPNEFKTFVDLYDVFVIETEMAHKPCLVRIKEEFYV